MFDKLLYIINCITWYIVRMMVQYINRRFII